MRMRRRLPVECGARQFAWHFAPAWVSSDPSSVASVDMGLQTHLDSPPIRLGYFRLLLRTFGQDPESHCAILEGTGVDTGQLDDPAAEISLFQQLQQIDNLTTRLGEGWPFLAPDLFGAAAHGALGVAAITAPDASGAMKVIARYSHVRTAFATRRLLPTPKGWRIELSPSVPVTGIQWQALTEMTFLGIRAVLTAVLGRPPRGAQYLFAGAVPRHVDRIKEVLGEWVSFDEPAAAFVLQVEELSLRSPYADPELHAGAINQLKQSHAGLSGAETLFARVQRLLLTSPMGRLHSAAAAAALGVSRRTLVRRLAEAGCTYHDLVDAELRNRASRLLADSKLSKAEISERLGYADPTSFSRASRRWWPNQSSPDLPTSTESTNARAKKGPARG